MFKSINDFTVDDDSDSTLLRPAKDAGVAPTDLLSKLRLRDCGEIYDEPSIGIACAPPICDLNDGAVIEVDRLRDHVDRRFEFPAPHDLGQVDHYAECEVIDASRRGHGRPPAKLPCRDIEAHAEETQGVVAVLVAVASAESVRQTISIKTGAVVDQSNDTFGSPDFGRTGDGDLQQLLNEAGISAPHIIDAARHLVRS